VADFADRKTAGLHKRDLSSYGFSYFYLASGIGEKPGGLYWEAAIHFASFSCGAMRFSRRFPCLAAITRRRPSMSQPVFRKDKVGLDRQRCMGIIIYFYLCDFIEPPSEYL